MEMSETLAKLVAGVDLDSDEMTVMMQSIMTGEATPAQIGSALTALRIKGETVEEITAAARVMRDLASKVPVTHGEMIDTCGTGGSGVSKFNVSTASAIVIASAGLKVAKHGNRAASGVSGSADVLEAAGLRLDMSPGAVAASIEEIGVGFLFAVNHHSAMKHAIGPRRELKFRTIFNLLGPLTNPAGARRQVLGVFDRHWLTPMAEVLGRLGATRAMVVHSRDGLDEISPVAVTDVAEWNAGAVRAFQIEPGSLDCALPSLDELKVADARESLEMIKAAFSGEHDAAEKMIALNAGAALFVADAAESLQEGVDTARGEMRSGRALEKLQALVAFSQESAQ